jgi:hypothetical protein
MQDDNFLDEQIINIDNNYGINIKVRTLDDEFLVKIGTDNKVEELKKRIENVIIIIYIFFRFRKYQSIGKD